MSATLVTQKTRRMVLALKAIVIFPFVTCGTACSQIVQLPSTGTFSLETSVMAPDSGSTNLGGIRRNAVGSQSLGPGSLASGATKSSSAASVQATIIDLNELDLMIRSQAGGKPTTPDLVSNQSKPSKYANVKKGFPSQNAGYEYLAAVTHQEKRGPGQISSDTTYYLSLATSAKQKQHWAAAELYYKLAWESLPQSRRDKVLMALAEARSKVANDESDKTKGAK
ncbi:MAG TPA: hypothetical protein VM260_03830 [Pirellula sp.]|nr:hypothetical protein [Pirellula sp.]